MTYINETVTYKPPQEQVIEYLDSVIRPDDKVGIFDFVPITETDLDMHKIPFERITVTESLASLESKQITYVVGTDKLTDLMEWQKSDSDPNLTDTEWEDYLKIPGNKLAEFGSKSLPYRSYPLIDLYFFVAKISKN